MGFVKRLFDGLIIGACNKKIKAQKEIEDLAICT